MKGLLIEEAKAFPKLKPTDKQTIKPGPAVEATASISSIFFPRPQWLPDRSDRKGEFLQRSFVIEEGLIGNEASRLFGLPFPVAAKHEGTKP
mgnify:CR=1 FL=1